MSAVRCLDLCKTYKQGEHDIVGLDHVNLEIEEGGFVCSGESPDGRLVEFIELPTHPFWVGTQAHPEFKSRPDRPAPLFAGFMRAALDRVEGRNPQLIDIDARVAHGA